MILLSQQKNLVWDKSSTPPYHVEFQVNNQPLIMEVDTGAALSPAPESAVAALLPSAELQPTNVVVKTYTGKVDPCEGHAVSHGQQTYRNLKLLVQGSSPSLMGRDWLKVIRLDWRNIER